MEVGKVKPSSSTAAAAEQKPSSSKSMFLSAPKSKQSERLLRLRDLHLKRNEARKLNHQEVLEEERRAKLPKNHEAKKRRAEWILTEEEKKEMCKAEGIDYERVKLLDEQADDLEKVNRLKARKKSTPISGFTTFEDASVRQYTRLVNNMKVDLEAYEEEKKALGEDTFYAGRDTIVHGVREYDKPENIDKMVKDLEKNIEKRGKFSRRRMFNDEADIDYINERNLQFNKKLERFYGSYTKEIKQNLERGTAI